MSEPKDLRAELGRTNELLLEARRKVLAQFAEDAALLNFTEEEVLAALGLGKKKTRLPAMYRDPVTKKEWSGRGPRPKWLLGKRLEDYHVDAPQPQEWWPGEGNSRRNAA